MTHMQDILNLKGLKYFVVKSKKIPNALVSLTRINNEYIVKCFTNKIKVTERNFKEWQEAFTLTKTLAGIEN